MTAASASTALVACALVSAAAALGLALLDPKRMRRYRHSPTVRVSRWTLAFVLFAPGVWLVDLGQADAFVAWLGLVGAVGWFTAQIVNRSTQSGRMWPLETS